MPAVKRNQKNHFHSQISDKSEEYGHDTTEKNSSNEKLGNDDKMNSIQ